MARLRTFTGVVLAIAALAGLSARPRAAVGLPERLTGAEFWRLVGDLSEENGYFRSDNLVGNEHTFQYVVPALHKAAKPGGVYLGVAPDQNFTYMLAVDPAMAFIVDIRRGNLDELLMYKAIFEMSNERADFVSRLFTKKRPDGLTAASSAIDIFNAYARVPTDVANDNAAYKANVKAIADWLVTHDGLPLDKNDLDGVEAVYYQFYWWGPSVQYDSVNGRYQANYPDYAGMMCLTDFAGAPRSYLATEANYRTIKDLETRNLIVPITGNFAGTKALRGVGQYIRDHGATVSAFYVSNVEQYLFPTNNLQTGDWQSFYENVGTLPLDESSTFVRSVSYNNGYGGGMLGPDGRASALDPIAAFVRDYKAGKIRSYYDVNARSK